MKVKRWKVLASVAAVAVVELVLIRAANVTSASATTNNNIQIWTGTVSTIGSSTITGDFSGIVTSIETGLNAQEFSASSGSPTVWGPDTARGSPTPRQQQQPSASSLPAGQASCTSVPPL